MSAQTQKQNKNRKRRGDSPRKDSEIYALPPPIPLGSSSSHGVHSSIPSIIHPPTLALITPHLPHVRRRCLRVSTATAQEQVVVRAVASLRGSCLPGVPAWLEASFAAFALSVSVPASGLFSSLLSDSQSYSGCGLFFFGLPSSAHLPGFIIIFSSFY